MQSDFDIRWLDDRGDERVNSLPALLAAMARDEVRGLPGLRPHQREPWHAFAVQVGAMALIGAGAPSPPTEETEWRSLLLALTPGLPEGEAWSLVGDDWNRPALLQPAVVRDADRADYKPGVATPDALDMLVTSRNHDVKAARMARAADEDWFFALLTLQTTEGYLGAGNFGISRMNGGVRVAHDAGAQAARRHVGGLAPRRRSVA